MESVSDVFYRQSADSRCTERELEGEIHEHLCSIQQRHDWSLGKMSDG